MVKGHSGRIVIEIDPGLKNKLYSVLANESKTLKDWFIEKAIEQIEHQYSRQLTFNDMIRRGTTSDRADDS